MTSGTHERRAKPVANVFAKQTCAREFVKQMRMCLRSKLAQVKGAKQPPRVSTYYSYQARFRYEQKRSGTKLESTSLSADVFDVPDMNNRRFPRLANRKRLVGTP